LEKFLANIFNAQLQPVKEKYKIPFTPISKKEKLSSNLAVSHEE